MPTRDKIGKYGMKCSREGAGHLPSLSYDCNGQVFVIDDPAMPWKWRREDPERADPANIVRCSQCDKPAVSLGHYSDVTDDNRCADHFGEPISREQAIEFQFQRNVLLKACRSMWAELDTWLTMGNTIATRNDIQGMCDKMAEAIREATEQ